MSTNQSIGHRVLCIAPSSYDTASLTAAISDAKLPGFDSENEQQEKAVLRQVRGWKRPRGLMAYSAHSEYKDLYVYFDTEDKTSPVNVPATKAFRCYGLDGNQQCVDWEEIRGDAIAVRAEPPTFGSMDGWMAAPEFVHVPLITVAEMVETLQFFKHTDARKLALKRDSARMTKVSGMDPACAAMSDAFGGFPDYYLSPTGVRSMSKVTKDLSKCCASCGNDGGAVGALLRCSQCKGVFYCNASCQKKHWKAHKKNCGTAHKTKK